MKLRLVASYVILVAIALALFTAPGCGEFGVDLAVHAGADR